MGNVERRYMAAAIRYAVAHEGITGTNPSVACLLVRKLDGHWRIVGRGITAIGGRPHAETLAIAQAGELARGATAYVTLEPCAHHGSTPPCAEALIAAGVERVLIATSDPDLRVNGKGMALLQKAGIEVVTSLEERNARYGLAGYLKRKNSGKPFVTLKLAVSMDGFLGREGAGQVPVTGAASRAQTHILRAINDAILVGGGTVRADNPELTCRLPGLEARSPLRIVLSRQCTLVPDSNLARSAKTIPLLLVGDPDAPAQQRQLLRAIGAEFQPSELINGKVALPELLDDLAARGISTLLVEGGARVASSFLKEGLVDRIHLYSSSLEIGAGGIKSPLDPHNIPAGFTLTRQMSFPNGEKTDTLMILDKENC